MADLLARHMHKTFYGTQSHQIFLVHVIADDVSPSANVI